MIVLVFVFVLFIDYSSAAFRYENRTLSCSVTDGVDSCVLTAPNTKLKNVNLLVSCVREPTDDGTKKRLACPIRCPKEYEVHVLNKHPSNNRQCTKYFTYGKYPGAQEWYIWMIEPCISTISTHCRYPEDVVDSVFS